jgi:SNF2 family DNA or RNA helicase
MPPIVGAFHPEARPWQLTSLLVDAFVDDAVRMRLWGIESGGPSPKDRRPVAVLARRVLSSLADGPDVIARTTEETHALADIAAALAHWTAPLTGRSPLADIRVVARVSSPIDTPASDDPRDDPHDVADDDPWAVDLFVSPQNDPSLLVHAAVMWGSSATVVHRASGQAALRFARQRLMAASPTLAHALDRSQPAQAKLTIDEVIEVLRNDADDIAAAGVELQLPQWWSDKARVSASGRATASEAPITTAGLNAKSLVAVDWSIVLGDDRLTEAELATLAAAKHDVVRMRGRWMMIDSADVGRALTAVTRLRRERAIVDPVGLLALAANEMGDRNDEGVAIDLEATGWASDLLAGLPEDRVEPVPEPRGFVGQLRPYQQRGVGWLAFLSRLGLGGVLADDMGLGKTAQLLALLSHDGRGPTLVVCPLSVVHNWETEAARFTPGLRARVHHGPGRASGDEFADVMRRTDVLITTFATAARDVESLREVDWYRLVVDEAQHVKNHHTHAAKALRSIGAVQRLALTGTPVENRLADLWSVMDLVNPGLLGSAETFRHNIAVPIERNRDADVTKKLRTTIAPFLLRRSKADKTLVPELPDKIEQTAWATLTREQASLYRAVADQLLASLPKLDGMNRRGAIVAAITKLKQICNHPVHYLGDGSRLEGRSGKLTRLDELLDDAFDADDQVIAFTQYVEMGKLVQRHLQTRLGMSAPFLHGSISKKQRDTMVAKFQSGDAPPLLLVSLKAGGSGLNLTAASQVIHIDRWWNPAVEDQASDRAWRIGQTSTVLVHKLASRGTIEERIDRLISEKRDLADRVIGGGEQWLTELSTDDLRDLITLEHVT